MKKTSIAATAALLSCAAGLACAAPRCPPPTVFTAALDHLDGYRVFTGPSGDSEVEPLRIDAKQIPLLKTGKRLGLIQLPTSPERGVQIVMGAADADLPMHPAPYKEMFVMLAGSVSFMTRTFQAEMGPGSVLLFEDVDARVGHGGRTGPCGYVSVSIKP